jgi:hypothetical protein
MLTSNRSCWCELIIGKFSQTGANSSQLPIQRIAVIGAIADRIRRLGFDHVPEMPMHSSVIRTAMRQYASSRTCVNNPQHRLEHMTGRYRLAPRAPIGSKLLRKMLANEIRPFVCQPNHLGQPRPMKWGDSGSRSVRSRERLSRSGSAIDLYLYESSQILHRSFPHCASARHHFQGAGRDEL